MFLLPVTPDCVARVIAAERPDGIMIAFGGQTGLSCGLALTEPDGSEKYCCPGEPTAAERASSSSVLDLFGCRLLGTRASTIEVTEDRQKFAQAMLAIGEQVAPAEAANTVQVMSDLSSGVASCAIGDTQRVYMV